jgi:phosphate acetyltransferase
MKTKSLMIISRIPKSGMRLIMMGIMGMLKKDIQKIAFFKPLVDDLNQDADMDFFKEYFKLEQKRNSAYALTFDEVKSILSQDKSELIYEKILEKYETLIRDYDFVLCEGMVNWELEELVDFDINFEIAKNLQIPTIELINGQDMDSVDELTKHIDYIINQSKKSEVRLLGLFINKLSSECLNRVKNLKRDVPIFTIPQIKELSKITMLDIILKTDAKSVTQYTNLDRTIHQTKVATMMLSNYLNYLEEGDLIIVSGDRCDIVTGTFLANYSRNYPSIAGILLTGGMIPPLSIDRLLEGTDMPTLPILSVNYNTQDSVNMLQKISPEINIANKRKIALVEGLFGKYIDLTPIRRHLSFNPPKCMTPVRFRYNLYEKAKASNSNILLTESNDDRVLRAVDIVLRRRLCKITLLGKKETIYQKASILGIDLSKAEIVDISSNQYIERFIDEFYRIRKDKGVVKSMAREIMSRSNYFATMMVHFGIVDGLVSGATHTTRETIKPAFQIIKSQKGIKIISSVFFMLINNRVLVYGDCAINPNPNADELAQIAISSAKTAESFGIKPIVAMLSYSSGSSGVGKDVEKVREATQIAKKLAPNLLIEGPMQYDTAIDKKVASQKMPNSKVAGRATVFIFPDLNTGNNTYKAVQRSANGIAIGPILQGLNRPFNDLSRGCLVDDIVDTVAITAVQAKNHKGNL